MITEVYQTVARLGVYSYPHAHGEHRTQLAERYLEVGTLVDAFSFEIRHPNDGWAWVLLSDGSGFILKRHLYSDTDYLLWYNNK